MLRWENVTFSYEQSAKNNVLDNASLAIPPGRVTVLTGPSGCGKSTLLYLAAGLYPKNAGVLQSGRVTLGGADIASLPPEKRARMVGMMFQNPDLQFCMDTVENELVFCLENINAIPASFERSICDALDFAGIRHLRRRRLSTLSGGEKQKAMLACVAALRPGWLLLDEPFANIDTDTAAVLYDKLREMNRRFGTSIVAVDHHLDHWLETAHEIIVLRKKGQIALQSDGSQRLTMAQMAELGIACPGVPYQARRPAKLPARPQPALQLSNLYVRVGGNPILNGCSANFYKGRIHAVIGKSGSGKSTLFNTLCRIHSYTGSVRVNGAELKRIRRSAVGRLPGCVFQSPQDQFISGSVAEEIAAGLKRLPEPERMEKTKGILQSIGLWPYRLVSPYMLSQGQQRRLAVAALLACDCDILVCDEPTYAQDYHSLTTLMDSLQRRVAESGLTLIFSTHDRKLAVEYADHIYEINGGQIYEIHSSRT